MQDKSKQVRGRLTAKQEKFCVEYAKTGNAVKSYQAAYSKGNSYSAAGSEAHKLLKNPKIGERLRALYEIHNAEKIMQAEEIQERLTKIARGDNGENTKDRLKAMELLGKMGGMFVSKQELDISSSIPVVIRDNI